MEKRSGFFPQNYNLLRMYHGVEKYYRSTEHGIVPVESFQCRRR